MGLWYWELMSRPDPAVLPVGTLHSLEWFWVSRRIFIYSHHNTYVFSLRCPSVRPSVWRGFRAFAGECIEGLAWNFTCWCTFTIFRTDQFMAVVWWFFKFWHYFDLVKRVKFGVSGHFLENAWREWPEILHADVSWPPPELISLWPQFADFFLILALFWLSETGQIWGFRAFPGERMEEMTWNFACWCILSTFRTD